MNNKVINIILKSKLIKRYYLFCDIIIIIIILISTWDLNF